MAKAYYKPLAIYNREYNKHPYICKEEINEDEQTFDSLEEWYACPYKYEIMRDAMEFKIHLRTISSQSWLEKKIGNSRKLGVPVHTMNTPILRYGVDYMEIFIKCFRERISGEVIDDKVPKSLINTDIGRTILHELETTTFSDNIFCHMGLDYRSFIVKDNKLVGIRNWQYAGYYPPELEDIIHRYLEYI